MQCSDATAGLCVNTQREQQEMRRWLLSEPGALQALASCVAECCVGPGLAGVTQVRVRVCGVVRVHTATPLRYARWHQAGHVKDLKARERPRKVRGVCGGGDRVLVTRGGEY